MVVEKFTREEEEEDVTLPFQNIGDPVINSDMTKFRKETMFKLIKDYRKIWGSANNDEVKEQFATITV